MKKQPVIAVIGAGALGVMFGQRMTQTLGPQRVFFAADAQRAARYAAQSFTCNGAACTFRFVTRQQAQPAALAVFAVKSTGLAAAIETMRPFIGPETLVISLLNGITSEGELAAAYGPEHVLYCVAQGMDAVKDGPAVTYRNRGKLLLGSGTGARTPAVDAAAALLLEAGVPCAIHEDILYRQWSKLMLNVGLNQVCAVYNVPYRGVQHPGTARDTMLAAMREAQALAAREGVTLTDADISAWMKMTDALNPDGMPSMRQDTLARRPTEVELFAGAMRRLGEKHSVPTPVNDMLYRRIAELEAAY